MRIFAGGTKKATKIKEKNQIDDYKFNIKTLILSLI